MTAPLVSIIINNYNYARFLGECIESALAQTYPATEVIVVDDGSTDHSRDVVLGFGDRVVGVFQANGGQGAAYNSGVRASRGQAVTFLDADDTLDPRAIETATPLLFASPGTSKVQWPLSITDVSGVRTGELSTKVSPPQGDLLRRCAQEGPLYDWYFTTGPLYPRWFLDAVLPVPEAPYRNGADVYLLTLAPVYGLVRSVDVPLATYRMHGANNLSRRRLDEPRVRDYVRRFEVNAAALERHLGLRGVAADAESWKRRSFNYVWPTRLLRAWQDIRRLVPTGGTFVLIDGGELGPDMVPDRHGLMFPETDGEWGGPPADDSAAVAELRLRVERGEASYVVVWWTAFWWLDEYPGLRGLLNQIGRCVLRDDHLIVFEVCPVNVP